MEIYSEGAEFQLCCDVVGVWQVWDLEALQQKSGFDLCPRDLGLMDLLPLEVY